MGIKKNEPFSTDIFSSTLITKFIIKYYIAKKSIDLIHLHYAGKGFFPLKALYNIIPRVIVTAHDFYNFTGGCHIPMDCNQFNLNCSDCPLTSKVYAKKLIKKNKLFKNNFIKEVNPILIAPSSYVNKKLKTQYVNAKIFTVGNAVSDKFYNFNFKPSLEDLKINFHDNSLPLVLSVNIIQSGRNNKGEDLIKYVINNMGKSKNKFNYLLVGSNIDIENSKNVIQIKKVSHDHLVKIYHISSLVAIPSRYETFSMVAAESILIGTPIIISDSIGAVDFALSYKGCLVLKSSSKKKFLNLILSNLFYKKRNITSIKESSTKIASQFSGKHIANKINNIYKVN
jgi:glycosyltransferase involved in cell wall biosynthesis